MNAKTILIVCLATAAITPAQAASRTNSTTTTSSTTISTYAFTNFAGQPGGSGNADGTGIAVDSAENLYVADYGNSTIRKITPSGASWAVTPLAGVALKIGKANGTGTAALFADPFGIAVDSSGAVYVTDTGNQLIRKLMPTSVASGKGKAATTSTQYVVTTLAGDAGVTGNLNGISVAIGGGTNAAGTSVVGTNALFNYPQGIAVDSLGNVYVADTGNQVVRKINPGGDVMTLGPTYTTPTGVAVDSAGNVYVADVGDNEILRNGSAITNGLNGPMGVAVDPNMNIFIANTDGQTIQWLPSDGQAIFVLAGSTNASGVQDGLVNWRDFPNRKTSLLIIGDRKYKDNKMAGRMTRK